MNPTLLPAGTQISVALGISTVLASMDFETYSEAGFAIDPDTGKVRGVGPQGKGGLGVVGTPVYAEHPSTEVLCLYYDLKDGKGRRGWAPAIPGFPEGMSYLPSGQCIQFGGEPRDLLEYVASGGLIEAWNFTFEWWIWNMIGVKVFGWPVLRLSQGRCAMAKARRHSLPGTLGKAAQVLGTAEKDKEGNRLIQKLCRPLTPTKQRTAHRWTAATAWDDFMAVYKYCDRDVETEDCAAACIPDLSPNELRTWQLDQTINARGVQVDIEALDACLDILGQTERKYTEELRTLTGYELVPGGKQRGVGGVSEVAKLGVWLGEQGVRLPDMTKDTVAEALTRTDLPPHAYRALEIRAVLGAANVKKLRKLKQQVSSDGRLRNQYMYCGAMQTGRASSAAADDGASNSQLQNITAKGPKTAMCESCEMIFGYGDHLMTDGGYYCPRCSGIMYHELPDWTVEAVEFAIADVLRRDLDVIEQVWGDPIALLCGCLRGLFLAKEGHELTCVDFSAVEAVVAACLSRCQWRIDVFNTHAKIYEMSAAKITGTPFEEILQYAVDNKRDHPLRKTVGKVAELGSGFGGWIGAWKNFGADAFMSDDEIKDAVLKWREESPEIVEMWGGQFRWCGPGKWDYRPELFGLEGCAINAILHPGECFSHIDITYAVYENILFCRLPSGRFLKYHRPRLAPIADKLNRGPAVQILFEGYNTNSQKGPIGWHVMETYGGRLFENCIAKGTPVLTSRGWVPIEGVRRRDGVHDGVEFVTHSGVLFKSEQTCVTVDGVLMTPDHEVLTDDGWKTASQQPRPYRPDLRHVDSAKTGQQRREEKKMALPVRVWQRVRKSFFRCDQKCEAGVHPKLRLRHARHTEREEGHPWHERAPGLRGLAVYARQVSTPFSSSLGELRGQGHNGQRRVATRLFCVLGRHGADLWAGLTIRQGGQRHRVLPGELQVGACESKREQQTQQCFPRDAFRADDGSASCGGVGGRENDDTLPDKERLADGQVTQQAGRAEPLPVYDILNCGPRHRFVVMGAAGPFIVHNCVQAVAADIQFDGLARCEERGYPIVMHTHDEGSAEMQIGVGSVEEMAAIMTERPKWASWWPLRAAGWRHKRYQKD